MILRCELDKVTEDKIASANLGEIKYAVPFDIDSDGMYTQGYLVITSQSVVTVTGGEVRLVLPIKKNTEAKAVELVGAGRLEITCDGICMWRQNIRLSICPSLRTLNALCRKF